MDIEQCEDHKNHTLAKLARWIPNLDQHTARLESCSCQASTTQELPKHAHLPSAAVQGACAGCKAHAALCTHDINNLLINYCLFINYLLINYKYYIMSCDALNSARSSKPDTTRVIGLWLSAVR